MPVIGTCPADLSLPRSSLHAHILSSWYQPSLPITADKVALAQPRHQTDLTPDVRETEQLPDMPSSLITTPCYSGKIIRSITGRTGAVKRTEIIRHKNDTLLGLKLHFLMVSPVRDRNKNNNKSTIYVRRTAF